MQNDLYPLLFQPVYMDYIWGGNRLAQRYNRTGTPTVCAESWEISDRPEGMSIVMNGTHKGKTLHTLIEELGPQLLGTGAVDKGFPLLIKLIDARRDLSVQVHPNELNCALTGGEPKTEMWYVLEADPSSIIYAGMKPGVTRQGFEKALHENRLESDVLASVPAKPGRSVFVPGGRVHAIGAGCLLLEVQQNSNTTYRVYDWGRMDSQGRARKLHLEQAMLTIDWNNAQPEVNSPRPLPQTGPNAHATLVRCPFFNTWRLALNEPEVIDHDTTSFQAIFVISGKVLIGTGGIVASAEKGTSCLIPSAAASYTLTPVGGPAAVIRITR